jgi:hypothetical protein
MLSKYVKSEIYSIQLLDFWFKHEIRQYLVSASYCVFHVMWVPCHHGMARPQVVDGGNDLQIWRVIANILKKQLQTAGKGWSYSLGFGVGLTTPHHKK